MRLLSFLAVFLLFGFVNAEALAEPEKTQTEFEVAGFSINADLPKPEFCLTFSVPIQHKDRSRILSSITLYKDGKRSKVNPDQLSVTPNDLCVQKLEHRSTYSLTMQRLQNAAGKRLARPYSNTFLMPDRKAALYFVEESRAQKMPLHAKEKRKTNDDTAVIEQGVAHVLRSVNVMATHLSLYRVSEREAFPTAWQHFKVNHIAPSESLSFARQRGQLVFESDLVFGDKPNEEQTLVAPLPHDEALIPGLYYLAATPRGREGSDITLFAGQWFLVTDMQFTASRFGDGLVVFASADEAKGRSPAVGVEIVVLAPDGGLVAEGKTDQSGFVYVGLDPEKIKRAAVIVAKSPNGNISMFETKDMQEEASQKDFTERTAIQTDLTSYRFGESVAVFIPPVDIKRLIPAKEETILKLYRPDHRLYSEETVRIENEEAIFKTVDLPLSGQRGKWYVAWDTKEGSRLGEAAIDVGIKPENAKVRIDLDHSSLGKGTTLIATVSSQDDKGAPLPLENGDLIISSTDPEIDGWKSYKFGDSTAERDSRTKHIPFMTNEAGKAQIQLTQQKLEELKLENIQGLSLIASLERGVVSQAVTLPIRVQETLVGIRMQPDDLPPSENGDAVFDVVSVDMVGKRRAEANLFYVLYEEGRSFKWFPSEGHWDYQPLPTHRRVAGGAFDINGGGENIIRVPVRTGQYVIEIANVNGDILARYGFDVGRRAFNVDKNTQSSKLKVLKLPNELLLGAENKVAFNLEKAAMVNAVIWDGQVRQTISRFMNAGLNEISIEPTASWRKRVQLQIQSLALKSQKEEKHIYDLPVRLLEDDLPLKVLGPMKIADEGMASVSISVQRNAKSKPTKIVAVTSSVNQTTQQSFLPPVWGRVVEADAEGKAVVPIMLPPHAGKIKTKLFAWNDDQFGSTVIEGDAPEISRLALNVPPYVAVGDKVSILCTLNNQTGAAVAYDYQIEAADGVILGGDAKGTAKLPPGAQKRIPLSLSAREPIQGEVRATLKSAGKEEQKASWPYLIRKTGQDMYEGLSQPVQEKQSVQVSPTTGVLVSPLDYRDAVLSLRTLLQTEPFTTEEIALWLEVMQEWHPLAIQLGLLSGTNYNVLRSQKLLELRRRQNDDGGFSVYSAGGASDLVSTAAALRLIHTDYERQSFFAVEWLTGRLQNTWFDERERSARAYAFQVLSKINKVDVSALRYFAETSKGKDLPISVSAMLAIALVHAGDATAAKAWISETHQALSNIEGDILDKTRALALMAFDETTLYKTDHLENGKQTIEGASWALMAMQRLSHRMKDWSVQVSGSKIDHNGVWALAGSQKAYEVQNASNATLYIISDKDLLTGNKGALPPPNASHQAVLFTSEGELVEPGSTLSAGKAYLLSIEVSAKKMPTGYMRVVVNPSSTYSVGIPAHGRASVIQDVYPFLPQSVMDMQNATQMVAGLGYEMPLVKEWRSVISVTPIAKGWLALPSVTLRDENGLFYQISDMGRFSVE